MQKGRTLLHVAAAWEQAEVLRVLLEHGAGVDLKNEVGLGVGRPCGVETCPTCLAGKNLHFTWYTTRRWQSLDLTYGTCWLGASELGHVRVLMIRGVGRSSSTHQGWTSTHVLR